MYEVLISRTNTLQNNVSNYGPYRLHKLLTTISTRNKTFIVCFKVVYPSRKSETLKGSIAQRVHASDKTE